MRAIRLVIAALVGLALAVAPVSAGFAQPPMGMAPDMHADMHPGVGADTGHVGMSTSRHEIADPCCDAMPNAAMVCSLKCCSVLAILIDGHPLPEHGATAHPDAVASVLSPFTRQPESPPPRA
jgi:hypothetical protein